MKSEISRAFNLIKTGNEKVNCREEYKSDLLDILGSFIYLFYCSWLLDLETNLLSGCQVHVHGGAGVLSIDHAGVRDSVVAGLRDGVVAHGGRWWRVKGSC